MKKMPISVDRAWQIAREFGGEVVAQAGEAVLAVYTVGSLASGYYRPGRSDIDTTVILSNMGTGDHIGAIKRLRESYRDTFGIPKDFGAVIIRDRELYPPYDSTHELVPEVIRLKYQGVEIAGHYPVSQVPNPSREAVRHFAETFYPWLRANYIRVRPSEVQTVDATINTLLYELRLFIWDRTNQYLLDKPKIIPMFIESPEADLYKEELEPVQACLLDENEMEIEAIERTLQSVSEFVDRTVDLSPRSSHS